jgi:hypothetical protein
MQLPGSAFHVLRCPSHAIQLLGSAHCILAFPNCHRNAQVFAGVLGAIRKPDRRLLSNTHPSVEYEPTFRDSGDGRVSPTDLTCRDPLSEDFRLVGAAAA